MIQKRSWILLVIFIILLILMVFFKKTPSLNNIFITPSPTSFLKVLPGWSETDLVKLELTDENEKSTVGLNLADNMTWRFSTEQGFEPDQGKVQQLVASLIGLEISNSLHPNSSMDQYGLGSPSYSISLTNAMGENILLNIGKETPTGSGYYVQVDDSATLVVNKYAVEGIMQLLSLEALEAQDHTILSPPGTPNSQ